MLSLSEKIPMRSKVVFSSVIAVLVLVLASCEPSNKFDARAIESLDKMSESIGNLSSCSYTLDTVNSRNTGIEIMNEHDVYMRAPDKMYVHTIGTNGEKSYWYNGSRLAYFSFTDAKYATINTPDNIMTTVDFMNKSYGIDFPATDFFYPDFTDDILENYSSLFFSEEEIDGVSSVLVTAINDDEIVQIWIDKATDLPHRMVIESRRDKDKFYDVVFSNWRANPELPDVLFDFEPPTNAEKIQIETIN